ncbi:MAG TPA: Wadjet anti-phage system protein JetD domain-containing protein [Vicinamibacterales bacterium]
MPSHVIVVTPGKGAAIVQELHKRWNRGDILAARVTGAVLFPMEIHLRRPAARDIAERFGEVSDWATALREASAESTGFGFELRRESVRNRVHGNNDLPVAAVVPREIDALRLIRQQAATERFQALVDHTLTRQPLLREWLARCPLKALEHADHWNQVLAVLEWFGAHPRPGLYLRQLDIPAVDTKFIEAQRGILAEVLDIVLPADAIDRTVSGVREFNQRYGLRVESPLVRFRILDEALAMNTWTDLSLPPEHFAALPVPVRRVFITENRVNGLSFPDCPGSIIVFGLGYGLERLADIAWMRTVDVHYWGDIDTHGFGILNRLRVHLPHARSFLMNRGTLDAHRNLWGQEPIDRRYAGDTSFLTQQERALFDDLRFDRLGDRVRLEQERISYGWLQRALRQLGDAAIRPVSDVHSEFQRSGVN